MTQSLVISNGMISHEAPAPHLRHTLWLVGYSYDPDFSNSGADLMKKLVIAICILLAYIVASVWFDLSVGPFLLWLAVVCVFCGVLANYYDNPNED